MPATDRKTKRLWFIIKRLAHLNRSAHFRSSSLLGAKAENEDCLGRVLRPHDEAGFASGDRVLQGLRKRLDAALDELTFQEIRRELRLTYIPPPDDVIVELRKLFRSEAFLRYVNAYLYFGVRFTPKWATFRKFEKHSGSRGAAEDAGATKCAETNQISFPLRAPPPLVSVAKAKAEAQYHEFRKLWDEQLGGSTSSALQFLDDFHLEPAKPEYFELEDPSEFELWLRGLRPDVLDESTKCKRFEDIRHGLTKWALSRADFYRVTLDANNHPDKAEIRGAQRRMQDNQVRSPIAARLALIDLYWIARILRAEVSSNGWVRYNKNNWLQLLRFNAELLATQKLAEENNADARKDTGEKTDVEKLRDAEDTLRSVFDSVLSLVQNSIECTGESIDDVPPETTWRWRAAFDEELDEIECQRQIRQFRDPSMPSETDWKAVRDRIMKSRQRKRRQNRWSLKVRGHQRPKT